MRDAQQAWRGAPKAGQNVLPKFSLGAMRAYQGSKAPQNIPPTKMAITRSILVRSRR
ncbi:hypothetical protein A2U01_0097389, partial [Trifolium medium]|nr:hypothetical protein [Trifolium medium]